MGPPDKDRQGTGVADTGQEPCWQLAGGGEGRGAVRGTGAEVAVSRVLTLGVS